MIIRGKVIPPLTIFAVAAISLSMIALIGAASVHLPQGINWHLTLRPSILGLLTSTSPYAAPPTAPIAGAPWGLWLLLPLALLPEPIGRAALLFLSLGAALGCGGFLALADRSALPAKWQLGLDARTRFRPARAHRLIPDCGQTANGLGRRLVLAGGGLAP
jgi:hypothetical protein